jgi:hypothetical protein
LTQDSQITTAARLAPEDPFAGLNPQVRNLLGIIPKLEQSLATANRLAGMVPAMQSRIDKLTAAQQAPSQTATATQGHRFEAIERVRNDLPEIAEALDQLASAIPQQKPQESPEPSAAGDAEMYALDVARQSWRDDINSTDFNLWLTTIPPADRHAIERSSKAGVIMSALSHFDKWKTQTTSTRQAAQTRSNRMASAVNPRGDGRRQRAPEGVDLQAEFEAGLNSA